MNQKISPAAAVVIALAVAVVVGLASWKMFAKPQGVQGTIPSLYSNPNGANTADPTGKAAPK